MVRGIIPARAGFTLAIGIPRKYAKDHPRSRGVYMAKAWDMPWKLGSSPLARGLQIGRPLIIHRSRIIPARAGFTVVRFGR